MFDDIVFPIIKTHIADNTGLRSDEISLDVDETVHAYRGELQINIYPGLLMPGPSGDQIDGEDWVNSFNIGITRRVSVAPDDRMYKGVYVKAARGLLPIFRSILIVMRRDMYVIQGLINAALEADPSFLNWKMIEHYRYKGDGINVIKKGPAHFNVFDKTLAQDQRVQAGIWANMEFGEARFMTSLVNGMPVV